jgi:general nucleoside transport system permease protein
MIGAGELESFVTSSIQLAIPLVFAATGELVSERAGVLNLSLEGIMLCGAFAGVLGSWATGHPIVGVALAGGVGILLGVMQAVASVSLRANQLVVGLGFNILALGATTFLYREIFGPLSRNVIPGFSGLQIPLLSDIPLLGPMFFQHSGFTYVALVFVCGTWLALERSALGLAIRATGESPRAADEVGLNVWAIRYGCVIYAGLMAGLGGGYLSLVAIHTFTENMTNGAGYLAITAVIFGGWGIWRTFLACLLFGFATDLQFVAPTIGLDVPVAVFMMLPYVLALLAIGGVMGTNRPPAALSMPFRRGT